MYQLIIFCVPSAPVKLTKPIIEFQTDFETSSQAELRALRWLMHCPNDIIMLLEVRTAVCKHCGLPIQEKPSGILNKWEHENGFFLCLNTLTRTAEPKEQI